MDPASHLLFGRTLGLAVQHRPALTGVTAALVIGSILPDADAVLIPRGFDVYLRAHGSGTHSLVGTAVEAVLLAVVLRVVVARSRLLPLLAASWVGVLGHVFWDLADGSDIYLLRPFSNAAFGWHLVTMGEPLVLVTLVAAVFVGWRRPGHARHAAAVALIALSLLLAVKRTTQGRARAVYAATVGTEQPGPVLIAPIAGRLFAWILYDRDGERVRAWRVDGGGEAPALAFEYRDAIVESDAAVLSQQLPAVRTFLSLSRLPFVRTERDGPNRIVLWSDITRCSSGGCDQSFGGAFDTNATPLYQLIRFNGFSQRRAVPADPP